MDNFVRRNENKLKNYKIHDNTEKKAITQYFEDTTYTCVPKSKFRYKLFIICGFDIIKNKSVLCLFALIMDETTQTFNFLFDKFSSFV